MPELPEVETYRRYFESTSLHQRIEGIEIRDARLIEGLTEQAFRKRLTGREFITTGRHGKRLFADTGDNIVLTMHFGMSGSLTYLAGDEEAPKYGKVFFGFPAGKWLVYNSRRMLGRLAITSGIEEYRREKDLGPDALDISRDAYLQALGGRKGAIKGALMNQSLLAGIGNDYADEILFQSGIHPGRGVNTLSENELGGMYDNIGYVLQTAVKHRAVFADMPETFILPRRSEGETCPICGGKIARTTVSGRTSYFCPDHQKG